MTVTFNGGITDCNGNALNGAMTLALNCNIDGLGGIGWDGTSSTVLPGHTVEVLVEAGAFTANPFSMTITVDGNEVWSGTQTTSPSGFPVNSLTPLNGGNFYCDGCCCDFGSPATTQNCFQQAIPL